MLPSGRMIWAAHVMLIREIRNACQILVGNLEGNITQKGG
jgi:hypothetical protein